MTNRRRVEMNGASATRRELLRAVAAASLGGLLCPVASADARVKRVAVLQAYLEESELSERDRGLAQALADGGFREGSNLEILWFDFPVKSRWDEVVPALVPKMIAARPDCIVAVGDNFVPYVFAATRTIPIVTDVSDPVKLGMAASFHRPAGNVTGFRGDEEAVNAKRIQILRSFAPASKCVAWIAFAPQLIWFPWFEKAAASSGLRVRKVIIDVADAPRWDRLRKELSGLPKEGCTAAHFHSGIPRVIDTVVDVARKQKLLLSYSGDGARIDTEGLLFMYAESSRARGKVGSERVAAVIARILRGEKPGDIPFEGPVGFYLNVNAKTAARLGLAIPPDVRILADRVLE